MEISLFVALPMDLCYGYRNAPNIHASRYSAAMFGGWCSNEPGRQMWFKKEPKNIQKRLSLLCEMFPGNSCSVTVLWEILESVDGLC